MKIKISNFVDAKVYFTLIKKQIKHAHYTSSLRPFKLQYFIDHQKFWACTCPLFQFI